jgi:glutamyl-tRNA reductase
MVLGAGKMSEISAKCLVKEGASAVWVVNRTLEHAQQLATELGGEALAFENRWERLAQADIILSSTGCPHVIVTREDAVRIHQARHGRPIFMIDIAVPRDIDPGVRDVPGVFLYDIDDLEQVVERNRSERLAAAAQAEKLVAEEARHFARKLEGERVVPTIVALRGRLEEILRLELENYRGEAGPLTADEEQHLAALTARLTQRIAGQLARELKQAAERPEQEQLAAAIRKLFRLPKAERAERRVAALAEQLTARSN